MDSAERAQSRVIIVIDNYVSVIYTDTYQFAVSIHVDVHRSCQSRFTCKAGGGLTLNLSLTDKLYAI